MAASDQDTLAVLAARSLGGDRAALEELVRELQPVIYRLSLRFRLLPSDAEDATQEILMKVITRLASFEKRSRFLTWACSIAVNCLRDMKRRPEIASLSFDEFAHDLSTGTSDEDFEGPDGALLFEEIRIGCTLAMLQCLDDESRLAYTLGEIMELDHNEAAEVMGCSPQAFRKRLSRSRTGIVDFMMQHCGLANPEKPCRCSRRVKTAIKNKCISPDNLVYAQSRKPAEQFPEVLREIRKLEKQQRIAALYRAQQQPSPSEDFAVWLKEMLQNTGDDA